MFALKILGYWFLASVVVAFLHALVRGKRTEGE